MRQRDCWSRRPRQTFSVPRFTCRSRGLDPSTADDKVETSLTIDVSDFDDNAPDDEEDAPPLALTDDVNQEAAVQLLAAHEAHEEGELKEHWRKKWPLMTTLTSAVVPDGCRRASGERV